MCILYKTQLRSIALSKKSNLWNASLPFDLWGLACCKRLYVLDCGSAGDWYVLDLCIVSGVDKIMIVLFLLVSATTVETGSYLKSSMVSSRLEEYFIFWLALKSVK